MNVLVTGSNGFIGTHVCRYLKEKGMYVIGMGRRAEATSKVDEYVCCDMSSDDIFEIPNKVSVKIDAVIHLAADMRKEPYGVEIRLLFMQKILHSLFIWLSVRMQPEFIILEVIT